MNDVASNVSSQSFKPSNRFKQEVDMRRNLFLMTVCILSILSCSEVEVDTAAQLEIIVLDIDNQPVKDVVVSLHESLEDLESESNTIKQMSTNNEGKVLFENLELLRYFFLAKRGELNNKLSNITSNRELELNRKVVVKTIIE